MDFMLLFYEKFIRKTEAEMAQDRATALKERLEEYEKRVIEPAHTAEGASAIPSKYGWIPHTFQIQPCDWCDDFVNAGDEDDGAAEVYEVQSMEDAERIYQQQLQRWFLNEGPPFERHSPYYPPPNSPVEQDENINTPPR